MRRLNKKFGLLLLPFLLVACQSYKKFHIYRMWKLWNK